MNPQSQPPPSALRQNKARSTSSEAALGRTVSQRVATQAGGREYVDATLAWASKNLGDDEKHLLNQRLGNPETCTRAFFKLQARAAKAQAQEAREAQPQGAQPEPPATGPKPFLTGVEMRAAMKDAKHRLGSWNKDPDLLGRLEATPKKIQTEL